jgi:hypothetical protein
VYKQIVTLALCLTAALGLTAYSAAVADDAKKADQLSLDELYQEVTALETLYELHFTPAQLKKLQQIAPATAAKPSDKATLKASAELRKKLIELRAALVAADDEDRIDELTEEFHDQVTAEKAELENNFEITETARAKAPEVLKMLTARQVAAYVGGMADDIPDPAELMIDALDKVRPLPPSKWKEFRDEISDQVGRLLGGLDADKAQKASDQVVQLLIIVRSLKPDEFKAQRPESEKKARQIAGDIGPTDILRHILEQNLAELLSNPRLPAAVSSRLQSD